MKDGVRECYVGSFLSLHDRRKAAEIIASGQVVGVFNRGVCALWFDGGNSKALRLMSKIKGEGRKGRPIALTLSLEEFLRVIDLKVLSPKLQSFLTDKDLKHKIGSLCFIRAPLKDRYRKIIPLKAQSLNDDNVCIIQNWDSFGHPPAESFLREVKKLGIKHPAVTSMNISGEPEIVDQKEGAEFCHRMGIPMFLTDPQAHPQHRGSYTIFSVSKEGIVLERDGNIPGFLFENIFGLPIDTSRTKASKHPQLKFPVKLLRKLTPVKLRQAILLFLAGYSPAKIESRLST